MTMLKKTVFVAALVVAAGSADAQTPAHDPTEKLHAVLPADVAARVAERIAEARARALPAQALENRALELAAKGAPPADIEQAVDGYAKGMELARQALERGRGSRASDEEVAAGGDVMLNGDFGRLIAEMARTAPADRSLAMPLYVLDALMQRGVSTGEAATKVKAALEARETDAELQAQVDALPAVAVERRNAAGQNAGGSRPAFAGLPAGVPVNPGTRGKPTSTPPVETPPVQTPPVGGPPPSF